MNLPGALKVPSKTPKPPPPGAPLRAGLAGEQSIAKTPSTKPPAEALPGKVSSALIAKVMPTALAAPMRAVAGHVSASAKAIITEAAQKHGIEPKILWGLYGTETNFGKDVATSSAGAVGPFQFEPSTAAGMHVDPYNFKSAAEGAARLLSEYKGRGTGGMLSAYNAGPAGGYQAGYVASTLANANTYGSASGLTVSKETPDIPRTSGSGTVTIPGTPSTERFNEAGFKRAQAQEALGQLFKAESGSSTNPLLTTGLLSTKAPVRSEYTETVPGKEAKTETVPTGEQQISSKEPKAADPKDEPKLAAVIAEADHIAEAKVPYLWGGGHQARVLPGGKVTPLDCSGAVSAALGINPKVASEFETWGAPGKGVHMTIWAKSTHVLLEIDGKFWGTSESNPGGGAGWIKPGVITPEYLKEFTPRHPAEEQVTTTGAGAVVKLPSHSVYVPGG